MSARIAVPVFPGTNSEDETAALAARLRRRRRARPLVAAGKARAATMRTFSPEASRTKIAFAPARSRRTTASWISSSTALVPESWSLGSATARRSCSRPDSFRVPPPLGRPTAAFAKNSPEPHFVCRHVHLKLVVEPSRCAITAALPRGAVVPAWAAHAEGRLAATPEHLDEIVAGRHLAFVYAHADGRVDDAAIPNGSALGCAGLVNRDGNVLAIMPHPERDGWNFNHLDRLEGDDVLAPSGGALLFRSFVAAVAS